MRRFLTIFLTISFFSVAYTQSYDEVSTGAQYSQQAYYNLSTGSVQIVNNNAWDIAFSNIGQTDAGIFINEAASLAENPVKLFVALDNDWSTPITDASIFIDDVQLFNSENNWTIGAFNETRNPDDPTDFGWGQYNPQSHQIIGNEVYVIKKRNGDFIKFKVDAYRNGYYHFRYANLDNSNEVQDSVARNTNGPKSLVHYSFDSKGIVKIDNGYDLVFTRYITSLEDAPGHFINYSVTGFLLAPGTLAVVADSVDVATVKESDYSLAYSSAPTTIGHDWKSFNLTSGWQIDEDRANFVKTKNGETYKLVFVDFSGSSSGTVTVERTKLATSKVNPDLQFPGMTLYPNPAQNVLYIDSDKPEPVRVSVINSLGRVVLEEATDTRSSITLPSDITPGMYHIVVQGKERRSAFSIVISK